MNDFTIYEKKQGNSKFWAKMNPGDFAIFTIEDSDRYASLRGSAYRWQRFRGGPGGPKFVARKTTGKGTYPTQGVISCHHDDIDPGVLALEVALILDRVRAHLDTLVIAKFDEPKGLLKAKTVDAVAVDAPLELTG